MKFRSINLVTLLIIFILASTSGCSEAGATPTEELKPELPAATAMPEETSPHLSSAACELIPNAAVVKFLYGLEVPFLEIEEKHDGIYCRFESVVVDGQGGDLGRGLAATTIKLWNSVDACVAAAEKAGSTEVTPPSPWSYVSILPIPDKPDLICSRP